MRRLHLILLLACLCSRTTEGSADDKQPLFPKPPVTMAQMEAALNLPCPEIEAAESQPLMGVLELLVKYMMQETGVPFTLRPDFLELELESINNPEDIVVRHLKIAKGSVTVERAIQIIIDSSDPLLAVAPNSGVFLVTTKAKTMSTMDTRVYDLSEFLIRVSSANSPRPGRQSKATTGNSRDQRKQKRQKLARANTSIFAGHQEDFADNTSLVNLLRNLPLVSDDSLILMHGQYAVITSTRTGHTAIAGTLQMLREAIAKGSPPVQVKISEDAASLRQTETSDHPVPKFQGGGGIF